jgi:hypothetical protein
MNRSKPGSRELLDHIARLSSEVEWTAEETWETLKEAGVSPEQVAEDTVQLVTRLKKDSPFHWKTRANTKRRELLQKMQAQVGAETLKLDRSQLLNGVKEAIRRLPAPAAAQYSVAFRKFEEATDDDLRSMLEELSILADLEKEEH